jgi:hypothetical protein
MRTVMRQMGSTFDPQTLFYRSQKAKVRILQVVEAVERLIGARPGQKLEVNFRAASLERTVHAAGRRLALGVVAAAALLGTAIVTVSSHVPSWVPVTLGAVGAVFTLALLFDLIRRRGD